MLAAPLEGSDAIGRALKARKGLAVGFVVALLGVGIASCGGGERQDADEPSGNFPVQVVSADFPSKQSLAQNTNLTLGVKNTGQDTIPDLAITIFKIGRAHV